MSQYILQWSAMIIFMSSYTMNVRSNLQPIKACGSRGSSSKGTAKQLVMCRLKSDTWIPCHSSHVFTQIFHHQCLTQQGANHPLGGSFGYLASVLRCQVLVPTDWLDANPTENMLHVVIWSVWQPSWIRPRPGCSGRRLQEGRSDGRPHPFCPNKGIALNCRTHHSAHRYFLGYCGTNWMWTKTNISNCSMGGLAFFASFDLSSFFSSLASSLSSFFSWCYIDKVKLACIVSAHLCSLSSGVQTKVLVFCHLLNAAAPNHQS